ncbi:MAG: hypothetical protein KF797_14505 [Flavobacteriales bacterium]|nr:hypothetical protein [Flavobacteriales bacterium]
MAEKIDIEASKNKSINCPFHWLPVLFVITFAITSADLMAQFGRRESACDTMVFENRYTRCVKSFWGRPIAFGNRNAEGQRHGWWFELNNDPENRTEGEYLNGKRVGAWWMDKHEIWHYDNKGNIVAKGSGCRGCPPF